jgi:hypothetical protein
LRTQLSQRSDIAVLAKTLIAFTSLYHDVTAMDDFLDGYQQDFMILMILMIE